MNLSSYERDFYDKLRQDGKSVNTIKNYKTDLDCFNNFLQREQKSLIIDGFTTSYLEKYDHFLQKKYSSNNSKRRKIQTLRIFFDFLVAKGPFQENPVRSLPAAPKFLDIPRPTPFSDIKTLWEYLLEEEKSSDPILRITTMRNQVMVLLIFGAGLKVSDIKDLKTASIILNSEKGLPRVMIDRRGRDPYSIPLPKIFSTIYKVYLSELKAKKEQDHISGDGLFFNANPYKILAGGLSPRGQEIIFEEFRKKLLLKVTPKSLRQASIFKWLGEGHKDSQIKEWLGVAPSYSLKLYKEHLNDHIYNDHFLEEIYKHYH